MGYLPYMASYIYLPHMATHAFPSHVATCKYGNFTHLLHMPWVSEFSSTNRCSSLHWQPGCHDSNHGCGQKYIQFIVVCGCVAQWPMCSKWLMCFFYWLCPLKSPKSRWDPKTDVWGGQWLKLNVDMGSRAQKKIGPRGANTIAPKNWNLPSVTFLGR